MPTKLLRENSPGSRGFTLLEVLVATMLGAMAISLVFFSWNYISQHAIVQQRKSIFQAEADRMAQTIAMEIRKSPEIISWRNDKIVFLSSSAPDTITYEFSNGNLLKNAIIVPCISPTAYISRFSIEGDADEGQLPASNSVSLVVTLGMEDGFGNASAIPLRIRANFPINSQDSLTRKWNF
ncbi:MAG: prepilin-type N-terminal cleavage/methylation domain-containing protein [Chitinivibrionales bacterium]